MSKGKMPIPETIYLVIGVVILFILVSVAMKIPGLGDWITNFLKGLIKPEMTAEELGIALNSMEALRFAIDVVANDGKVPTAMVIAGVPTEEKKPSTCKESFAQYGNKQISVTEKMNKNGYSGDWTLKISSIKNTEVCTGTTKEECGTREDDVIIEGWCGGVKPNSDASNCNKNLAEEKQPIQCTIDNKWYWVTFSAELVKGKPSQQQAQEIKCKRGTPSDDCKKYEGYPCCITDQCYDVTGTKTNYESECRSTSLPTGGFFLTIKNKITGMATAGKDAYYGCSYTKNGGKIEASCKHDSNEGRNADSVKVECSLKPTTSCSISGFELPEPITIPEDVIHGYGDPRFLGYWQKFPMGEEVAWDSLIAYEENVGLAFLWGVALTTLPSCFNPFAKSLPKQTKITEFMTKEGGKLTIIKGASKEAAEEFLKVVKKHPKLATGFGAAGTAAAVADWLDSKGEKYNEVENSMVLKIPGKKTYKFELSPKAKEYFVMLDKPELAGADNPLYFASPCKIDMKVETSDKIGCGKFLKKEPEYDFCCKVALKDEYYWSQYECLSETFGEIPEDDVSKCGEKPEVKQDYFLEGLPNYCLEPTQYASAQSMKTIIVKDTEHYKDKDGDYDKNNFCYTSGTKEGALVLAGSIIADAITLKKGGGCLVRGSVAFGGALLSTKVADVTTWPGHWERAWN